MPADFQRLMDYVLLEYTQAHAFKEFRNYGNNPIILLGTKKVELASNGWSTAAKIKVIEAARPSIIGRNLMPQLGLQLVQRKPGQEVTSIQQTVAEDIEAQFEK